MSNESVNTWWKGALCAVMLKALIASTTMLTMSPVNAQAVPTHCKPEERAVFSCPFRNGKTASLCASPDLTKITGTLQYRYGVVGKNPELMFPDLDDRTAKRNHPKNWFTWSSSLWIPLDQAKGASIHTNTLWSTANVPPGQRVGIYLGFSPINENPAINFTIQAEAGSGAPFQGAMLLVRESVGQGRPIAEHRCIREKTTEDLFSLKDIVQK